MTISSVFYITVSHKQNTDIAFSNHVFYSRYLRLCAHRMTLLSISREENSWIIFRGLRAVNRSEKSTCSSLESMGRSNTTVSIP